MRNGYTVIMGLSLGGLTLAQLTQSPAITLGAVVVAVISFLTVWVRERNQTKRLELEVELAKNLGRRSGTDRRRTTPASAYTPPHSEGS
jgi:hypothetical protein